MFLTATSFGLHKAGAGLRKAGAARFLTGTLLLIPALVAPIGCASGTYEDSDTLTIGAYSVIREALHEGVLPTFAAEWQRRTGRSLRFEESYNASGAQARAVASGFDADVVLLSHEGDVDILVKAKLVDPAWREGPHGGLISRSLVVIGVREGNPKQIGSWEDLSAPGVGVLYPDPKTSGGARWNVNAVYGAGVFEANPPVPESGELLLRRIQANVVNLDPSGRQSMATFRRGTGDAVVTYENELLLERKLTGSAAPYVLPARTLLIESPAAIVEASVQKHGNRALAEAFLEFVRSDTGQTILSEFGFRRLDGGPESLPERPPMPPGVFHVSDLGGWSKLQKLLYSPGGLWDQLFLKSAGSERGRP